MSELEPLLSPDVCLLGLAAKDRLGTIGRLTKMLAERGISIERIHTDIVRSGVSGKQPFQVETHLLGPASLSGDAQKQERDTLACRT